ncbi:MAG: carbohydrate-binding domain-containing protein [Hominilimicola sp.]
MKMKKKIISAVTLISLIAALGSGCVMAKNDGIKVTYDGNTIDFDVQPEIIDDRVMVPMRTIFETFGAKVKWDSDAQTITAKKKSKTISMTIGNADMTKNDETYSFDTAPVIEDGRTLVPVRAISDMLGLDVEWDENNKNVTITTPTDDEDNSWKENIGTINLDTLETTGDGVSVSDNIITISKGGDFEVTGTLDNGQIVIDTEDKAKLRLSGMSLTNKNGAAVYVKNADKAYITITENTENTMTDGENYTSGDENEKACITSRDNLEIKGNGSLTVNGNYNHGIDGSDSVEIGNGNIKINAKNDGIHVNDTLEISGGTLNITAEGDGIQSDEIVDISGGIINVTTTGDVPATVSTQFGGRGFDNMDGGIQDMSQMTDEERQAMREERQKQFEEAQQQEIEADNSEDVTSKGIKADWLMDISGGDITVNSTDHAIHCASDLNIKGGSMKLSSESKKGISAHGDIVIDDGDIDITKSTEGIETKQIMTINGGNINVAASDDGFNAGGNGMGGFGGGQKTDRNMGGNGVQVTAPDMANGVQIPPSDLENGKQMKSDMQNEKQMKSDDIQNGRQVEEPNMKNSEQMPHSDMEIDRQMMPTDMQDSERPQINGGEIQNGGGRGGNMNTNEISSEHHIQINGGNIYINAANDGIDSNGSLVIDGGNIIIEGPPTAGGGELGLDTDGALIINGGEVLATGSSISASGANQNTVNINLSESVTAGTLFAIKDTEGETVVSFTASRAFSAILYSSDKLETGKEYGIYVDGEQKDTFTVTDKVTTVGTATGGFGNLGGGRGNKGQKGQQIITDNTMTE